MLGFLFRTLTADTSRGVALFRGVTAKARERHWLVEGGVPDSIDGRFAVLATVAALVIVRLQQLGQAGNALSVALTERFIEVMESEHRELGLGDPTLGKTVRKLVGALSRRTELWRLADAGERDWSEATRESLYKGAAAEGLQHSAEALRTFRQSLQGASVEALEQGRLE